MYPFLLSLHSVFRWLVLASLLLAIFRAYRGYSSGKPFTKADNALRHWTATVSHVQLMLGFGLYFASPIIRYFWGNFREAAGIPDTLFFGILHALLMLVAVVLVTLGSALAKRRPDDRAKFRTMLLWFSVALLVILVAIPWPFSPFAARPLFRPL